MGRDQVIVLDTHIWVWWVDESDQLSPHLLSTIRKLSRRDLCISAISCWEVAKLVEKGRLQFKIEVDDWMTRALRYVRLLPLSPHAAIESARLPGEFHRDPADQLIVATARIHDCAVMTVDQKIIAYPHVKKAP
jgi:PIN domain nuclease of toxin-antitoxin system